MCLVQVRYLKGAAAISRKVKYFDKGHQRRVLSAKTD